MGAWVRVGSVRTFRNVECSKEQALKPLEEAAEVFGAWQTFSDELETYRRNMDVMGDGFVIETRANLLDECADVIQATANLIASLKVEDFRPYMDRCEQRNRERGRITK